MEMTERPLQAVAPSTDRWKPIFRDPTFGGECIPLPAKEGSGVSRSASYIADHGIEDLPLEVRCLVSNSAANSPEPAGSPLKAAQYLRRMSGESDHQSDDSSAFSDITTSLPNTARKEKVEAGGNEGVEECQQPKMSVVSAKSKDSNNSRRLSDVPSATALASLEPDRESGGERSRSKSSGGFSDVSAASKREAPPASENVGRGQQDDDEKDSDLLSNPFATDSEQEEVKPS